LDHRRLTVVTLTSLPAPEVTQTPSSATDAELERLRLEVSQLRYALTSRATIEQAKGIVMTERHCTPGEAFGVLVRLSQNSNVPLRDVARALVYQQQRT
jgi:AmiR/NasT family two-component response regulator